MRSIYFHALFVTAILCVLSFTGRHSVEAQKTEKPDNALQTATLLNDRKYHDNAKATFNFALGVRGDSKAPATRNLYDLRYGGSSLDGGMDWFDLPMGEGYYGQLKDLGEMKWQEIFDIPILHASQWPHINGIKLDLRDNPVIKVTPENIIVEAVLGHIYLLHTKHHETDLYVLFRIDALKPEDECTISWKIVPSPEAAQ